MNPVTLEIKDGVARVALNRPQQLNAISPDLLSALDVACDTIEKSDEARVVTLTGNGRVFCAGADLKVVQETAPERSAFSTIPSSSLSPWPMSAATQMTSAS